MAAVWRVSCSGLLQLDVVEVVCCVGRVDCVFPTYLYMLTEQSSSENGDPATIAEVSRIMTRALDAAHLSTPQDSISTTLHISTRPPVRLSVYVQRRDICS
jgi:hypothetical protein